MNENEVQTAKHSIRLRRFWGWAVFAGMVLGLAACSTIRLGYTHADRLALYYIDNYLDLDAEQEIAWRDALRQVMTWHRQQELPGYIKELEAVRRQLNGPVSVAQVHALNDTIRTSLTRTAHMAAPLMADLLPTLRPEQLTYLQTRLEKANAEYRAEQMAGSVAEQNERRYERLVTQLERWFGDFSPAQRGQIRAWSDARPLRSSLWYQERLRRQDELRALLRYAVHDKPARSALTQRLRLWIDTWPMAPADRRITLDEARGQTLQLLADVANLADAGQKRTAVQRVQMWIDDFTVLVAQR